MTMHRRFGWAMLVAAGVVLGFASSSYQRTNADPPPPVSDSSGTRDADAEANANANAVAQLKEINAQLKEINTMLRTGTARVTLVITPGRP